MEKPKKMAISAEQYQKRLQPLLNLSAVQSLTEKIVLRDKQALKNEKIDEWQEGERPDESKIGTYRNKNYRELKKVLNPKANGYVDLLLTGQTASTLFVHKGSEKGSFIFGMKDTHNLIGRYGKDIMGLNQTWFINRQKEVYLSKLIQEIKRKYKIA